MYKPTLYITMEADPSRYNPEGEGLASRLWSFTAPVVLAPSPTGELGLKARMKCSGRPYWNSADATQNTNWETIARPYLNDKVFTILDVFSGLNVKRYEHYSGPLHYNWLKLDLAPYEIRFALDYDADDVDYLPNVMGWMDTIRGLVNTPEFAAYEAKAAEVAKQAGENGPITVFVPARAEVEANRALRAAEAEDWAKWNAQQAEAEAEAEAAATTTAESENAEAAAETVAAAKAETPAESEPPLEKPELSGALGVHMVEFISHDGASLFYNADTQSWVTD